MRSAIFALCVAAMTMLSACATPVQHNTPSGKVEATIRGTSKATVKDRITDQMINKGYSVTRSDDSVITFDRPVDDVMASVLLGSRYDGTPNARIIFNLIQTKGAVRVVVDCMAVTNPGSSFERKTPLNNTPETARIQDWLNNIKTSLEKKK